MSGISDFISTYGDLANSVASQTGLSQSEVLGQWGLETGWGSSFAGQNNFGNVSPGGKVANYSTPQAGAQAYMNALASEKIPTADLGTTPALFGKALQSAGYATDPNYADKVYAATMSVQNAMGGSATPVASNQSPFMSMMTNQDGTAKALTNADGSAVQGPNLNVVQWLSSRLGDFSLVFFGLVLGVGALLISQKSTVIQIAKTVAK